MNTNLKIYYTKIGIYVHKVTSLFFKGAILIIEHNIDIINIFEILYVYNEQKNKDVQKTKKVAHIVLSKFKKYHLIV